MAGPRSDGHESAANTSFIFMTNKSTVHRILVADLRRNHRGFLGLRQTLEESVAGPLESAGKLNRVDTFGSAAE